MSLAIRFTKTSVVAEWLRWIAQPRINLGWSDKDFFVVKQGEGVWVHLADVAFDDPAMSQVLDLLDCQRQQTLPASLSNERKLSPTDFLQIIKVVPGRPSTGRRDLLVAFYETTTKAVGEVFSSVPKNSSHPSTLVQLAHPQGSDLPHHLILLPQADLGFHWSIWLDAENQRLGITPRRKIELYLRLEGGLTAEYYVQYGYSHPVPLLPRLFPNPHDAHLILIAGEGRDGKLGTRWTHISSNEGDSYLDVESAGRDSFAFELQDKPIAGVAQIVPPSDRVKLTPQLVTLGNARREELDRLEKRIQTTKDGLFDLEQQRIGLLDREQNRFYLLLRFRQEPGQREMAYEFQRFLVLTQRQLERFHYAFQDEGNRGGYHVVRTREPVFYQDVHMGLATDVYRQELPWNDWHFPVFVRDGWELFPRIDSHELGDLFRTTLQNSVKSADLPKGDSVMLVNPPAPDSKGLRITVLPISSEATLKQHLRFLNTTFTVSLEEARVAAGKELRDRVDETAAHFEDEIDKAEQRLSLEADNRLAKARELWHEVAGRIQTTVREVERCDDQLDAFNEMVRNFAQRWRAFLDHMLKFNDELIEGKLEALKALERAQKEWQEILDRIDKANTEVPGLLAPLRQKMEERLERAEKRRQEIEKVYRELDTKEREVRVILEGKCRQVDQWLYEVRIGRDRIEAKNTELAQKRQELSQLLSAVESAVGRLRGNVQGFERELNRTNAGIDETEKLTQTLQKQSQVFEVKKLAWADQRGRVERDLSVVRTASEQTVKEIGSVNAQILEQKHEASELERTVAARLHTLKKDLQDVRVKQAEVEAQLAEAAVVRQLLKDARQRLMELEQQLKQAQLNDEDLTQQLRQTGNALAEAMKEKRLAKEQRLRELRHQMTELASDLEELARVELSMGELDPYRKAVKLRSDSVTAARRFSELSEETHKRLYQAELK